MPQIIKLLNSNAENLNIEFYNTQNSELKMNVACKCGNYFFVLPQNLSKSIPLKCISTNLDEITFFN